MPTLSAQLTPEATAFLQRRVAILAALSASLGFVFALQRFSQVLAIGDGDATWTLGLTYHAVGIASMGLLFALTWFGRRGERFIRSAELLLFCTSCISYTLMAADMPQVFRPNFSMLLVVIVHLLIRSIWVPSTWRWSSLLSLIIGVPLLVTVWQRYAQIDPAVLAAFEGHDDFFEVSPRNIRIDNLVATAMWFSITAFIAALASGVIHGLRRDVRKARRLGQYILEEKLGEGGMGVVYRARHALLRRPTAVKLMLPERAGEENLARFELEVRAASRLSHPNTVTVFDYGRTPDGIFYYAMELLEGATLTELVRVDGPMPPARVAHFLHQVASALAEAHGMGLIHRDIKPDNIVVTERGGTPDVAKVVDFGLVKEIAVDVDIGMTGENTIVGTPMFLAPEAIRGRSPADGRGDLYALGATAFFMLTGEHVFAGETVLEICSAHLLTQPDRPSERLDGDVPEDFDALVLRCLAKDPDGRPASAQAFAEEVEELACFGEWSRKDARRWWNELGPDIASRAEARRAEESTGDMGTIEIDVQRS